jgi:Amt family ammonium transporter|mmetsp:Transcript_101123/g.159457  ORF Transcript_101123/g.159457 Transcript_101123/m.159457 type:complete len:526 (-) Transcript_101123:53-1630(-)|eukprot:CAMPEP_0169261264 /NCGR_PEP_ID=MMETSP1016-20121227/42996_1 /TAXON_ID=342587 /ORGANISM="Karlodinium micrum, Strain CCMP2283" /LENGTH=525 /DNA_ID=CAMNT_0009343541 /DNA_START=32 /DNA_END=1609 /DNA_ORIENTATION=-
MASLLLLLTCAFADIFQNVLAISDSDVLQKLSELEDSVRRLESENSEMRGEVLQLEDRIAVERQLQSTADAFSDIRGTMDTMWVLICAMLIMVMQAGFAMVESGTCRVINVQNILLKNMVDVCVGTVCWFAFGWSFAFGFDETKKNEDVFAGHLQYFGHEFLEADADGNQVSTDKPAMWFFQWTFCATSATIVSGGVAERVQFPGYLVFTACMTTFIYPIVVAWMWSSNGWLTAGGDKHLNEVGFNDFAGSGVIHMTGGIASLVGSIAIGPRKGRFDPGEDPEKFNPHNLPFIVLGTFILWYGWYGFNCGSTLGMSTVNTGRLAAIVAMNTTLSASAGGLVVIVLRKLTQKRYDIGAMCNGILAGLVSVTAGCANVEFGSALLIGCVGGCVFNGASFLVRTVKIDDPIDAFAVHGACGCWGVLAAALFDWGKGFDRYNGFNGGFSNTADLSGNKDDLWKSGMAAALIEVLVIAGWVGSLSALIFVPMRLLGLLRASNEVQDKGMDASKHSPTKAYYGDPYESGIV